MKLDEVGNLYQEQLSDGFLGPDFDVPWFFFRSHTLTPVFCEIGQ